MGEEGCLDVVEEGRGEGLGLLCSVVIPGRLEIGGCFAYFDHPIRFPCPRWRGLHTAPELLVGRFSFRNCVLRGEEPWLV